jgi:hypothetical protein
MLVHIPGCQFVSFHIQLSKKWELVVGSVFFLVTFHMSDINPEFETIEIAVLYFLDDIPIGNESVIGMHCLSCGFVIYTGDEALAVCYNEQNHKCKIGSAAEGTGLNRSSAAGARHHRMQLEDITHFVRFICHINVAQDEIFPRRHQSV